MTDCPQCDDEHPRGSPKCPGHRVNTVVDGRYEIVKLLGVGGAGAVYEARAIDRNVMVALKMLHKEMSKKRELSERFQREALTAAAVSHPGMVQVGSMGEDREGCLYLELELLRGQTLDKLLEDHIARKEPLPFERAVGIMSPALDALHAAHGHGIVHRDIKPENIFLSTGPDGKEVVKILDLGIAKLSAAKRMTKTGEMLGTPMYMSPEQVLAASTVDARADVYSIGATLFQLLTLEGTIKGHMLEVMAMVVQGHIRRNPRELRADTPEWLDKAVARSLAFEPQGRFQTALEFKETLDQGTASWWKRLWKRK